MKNRIDYGRKASDQLSIEQHLKRSKHSNYKLFEVERCQMPILTFNDLNEV